MLEEKLKALIDMGFDPDRARSALMFFDLNEASATEYLLSVLGVGCIMACRRVWCRCRGCSLLKSCRKCRSNVLT